MEKEKLPKEIISIAWILVFGAIPPMLDTTIVNIAVNDITKMFSTNLAVAQWIVTGYTLALGIAVPFSGWLMKKYDGKKIFMGALGLFLAASLLCGLAWDMPSLIAFRVLQGFASGLMIPTLTALVVQIAGNENIGSLMSIVGIPIVFAPIIGPVIGGLILQYLSWHWLFFVNLPIGVIALLLMQWKLPKFEAIDKSAKMDWPGVLLLALISTMFILGVTEGREPDFRTTSILAFAVGVVSLIAYLVYAWKKNDQALIPLSLFKSKNFSASFVSLFLAGFATNGPMLLLPMFFQNVKGLSVIESALWLVPQGIGMLVARPLVGKLTDQFGARLVVLPSIVISLLGTLPFVYFDSGTLHWMIWMVLFIRGIGIGGITVPVMSDSYVGLEKSLIPAASVATRITQNIGAAFGSAILATVVSGALSAKETTVTNMADAYHLGFLTSLIFMMISIIPSLFLTDKKRIH
ncbi:MAG: DHA2 family efflux MFS transporter permease subunit [Bacilli bacterium]|jgi:EmrB/QacA subfamily drug resistance transporter|uniref:MDR family MFS transporter n=1 Tax=Ureibacillus sp. FSL K6-3587 TaxID=2954681 RepID=UPI00315875CD